MRKKELQPNFRYAVGLKLILWLASAYFLWGPGGVAVEVMERRGLGLFSVYIKFDVAVLFER